MQTKQQKKDSLISALVTLAVLVITIALCAWIAYYPPDPPIEEEGMGVSGEILGEIEGFGNNDMADFPDNAAPAPASSASEEGYTTGEEPAPVAKNRNTEPAPQPKQQASQNQNQQSTSQQTQTSQPATNPNASFRGRNKGTGSEGKGAATGSGQAGSETGTQGASGGSGQGSGVGYDLGGRGKISLPAPNPVSQKNGNVVVTIYVDQQGNVVEVDAPAKGSYTYDNAMVEEAKRAARKAKFKPDPNAPARQRGTITYQFRTQG